MPCKGDELCCEDSTKPHEFDNSPKTNDSNGFSSDNNHSFEQPLVQPQQQPKPVTNGVHDGPKQILIERRTHPSGISFESISPLPGEELKRDGITDMSNCRVFLSNYRIVIVTQNRHGVCSIPLIGVDSVEAFDETLKVICKDGRIFTICAETQEIAMNWYKMVAPLVCGSHKLEDVFAFKFGIFCTKQRPLYLKKNASFIQNSKQYLEREFANCGFNEADWRISTANKDFKICATYPQYLIVPNATTDEELTDLKRGRFFERFPTAVWRSKQGGILLRSSQPEISFFGTYHEGDIKLFDSIRKVTVNEKKRKILVIDARSYGAALANRAKGGGFEGGDGYSNAEVVFMSLPNIHSLRYSFHQLRQLLNSSIDSNGYFQALNTSQWLQYLFNLIVASQRCVDALCSEGLSVLVHCSDGWDRTTQLVSLVKLIADPYYRTFEGFERLIIRDWIEFGHKFNDRNGVTSTDTNERSPVFMQFIDAVHQLWLKNPDAFEFNQRYLMKLAQHQYSGFFGTFLFNSFKELLKHNSYSVKTNVPCFDDESAEKTSLNGNSTQLNQNNACLISVFDYLNKQNPTFMNPVYDAKKTSRLACPKRMWELQIWSDVYCCTDTENIVNNPENICHNALGDLSIHGDNSTSDKLPTVSRSQSAASLNSLTSLEQATNGIHCNGSSGNHSTPSGGVNPASFVSSSYSTVSFISTKRDYPQWKTFIDCDGLSKVDIALEDRIVELQRQMTKNESNARTNSESSAKQHDNHGSVIRQRVESSDSNMFSFDLLDDLEHHRKKRDSTCSSNVVFEFCPQRTASDALISTLNEEELLRCENCQDDIADENSADHRKNGVKCSRCTDQIPRSSSRVVVN